MSLAASNMLKTQRSSIYFSVNQEVEMSNLAGLPSDDTLPSNHCRATAEGRDDPSHTCLSNLSLNNSFVDHFLIRDHSAVDDKSCFATAPRLLLGPNRTGYIPTTTAGFEFDFRCGHNFFGPF